MNHIAEYRNFMKGRCYMYDSCKYNAKSIIVTLTMHAHHTSHHKGSSAAIFTATVNWLLSCEISWKATVIHFI